MNNKLYKNCNKLEKVLLAFRPKEYQVHRVAKNDYFKTYKRLGKLKIKIDDEMVTPMNIDRIVRLIISLRLNPFRKKGVNYDESIK